MKKLLPIIALILICAAFFYKTLTQGLLPVPSDTLIGLYHPWRDANASTNPRGVPYKNFLITDPIRQQIPWRKIVIESFRRGELPLWNPYNFSGTPLLSNIQAGSFYPFNFLFFFLPFDAAWSVLIIIQPILAAVCMYLYLAHRNVSPGAAVFGAVAWAFCGFSVAWLTWGTMLQTALWLPLILLAIDMSSFALFIIASVLALFAGHAQVALYCFGFAGLYGLAKRSWRMAIAAIIAITVSSVQWMPMARFALHSSRLTDGAAWLKDGWFLPWQNLIQFIAPDFFGNPATLNYTGIWNYGEFIGYIGILPLIFVLYAILSRHDRLTRFFAVCTGVVFLFLLPTPVAKLPYLLHIPFLSSLQPTRLMVVVDICLAILAALGLDAYIKKPSKKIAFSFTFVGIVLAAMWIYVLRTPGMDVARRNLMLPSSLFGVTFLLIAASLFIKKKWQFLFVYVVVAITIFDVFRFGWKFTPFTPRDYFFPITSTITFLQSQAKPFRVMSLDNRILPPNVNAYYGIESVEGYDPIYDARYEEFIAALNRGEPSITPPFGFDRIITLSRTDSPLLRLLNVSYILTFDEMRNPDMELMYKEGNTRMYFYKKAMPRIYPVESLYISSSKQEVINRLYSKEFNPTKEAVVEEHIGLESSELTEADTVTVTAYSAGQISAATAFARPHFVVIANMYDPGWKAMIDSNPATIYRTNYLFQGIVVPKGNHTLILQFKR